MFSASVIISFYNNIDAMRCIIKSLENQKENFEIIIADDGSSESILKQLNEVIEESSLSITHIWQKDIGFRKNRILNKAVKKTTSPYLIFIDGDCIPQTNFIRDHLSNKRKNTILNGRRVDMAPGYKKRLYDSLEPECFFNKNIVSIITNYLIGNGKNIEKGIRLTNSFLFTHFNRKIKGIVGCNFSLYKEDFVKVNGFDNRYDVPCIGEDTDIEYRLLKTGLEIKNIFHQAIILHIIHPELPRLERAEELFLETKTKKQFIALNGYQQAYDSE